MGEGGVEPQSRACSSKTGEAGVRLLEEGVQAWVCGIKQVREALSGVGIQGAMKDDVCGMLNDIFAVRAAPLLAWQAQPPAGLLRPNENRR